jgi:hypothetical protein
MKPPGSFQREANEQESGTNWGLRCERHGIRGLAEARGAPGVGPGDQGVDRPGPVKPAGHEGIAIAGAAREKTRKR